MYTLRKSKWRSLVAAGTLLVIIPRLSPVILHFNINETSTFVFMIAGILLELTGIVLMRVDNQKLNKQ